MSKSLNQFAIEELAPMLENKEISPVEVTNAVFNQIDEMDDKINSYISVTKDQAIMGAKVAEQEILSGNYRGKLHGVPMAIKDNIYFKGSKTTMGSKIHQNFIPEYDATVVEKLRDQGVIFTGKLNLHEYAWGATTNNPHYGACRNPWDLDRIPGGSSGGSGAAVAAHLTIASLGTDTGGSIRIPSSFCGIIGLKPTHGLVSKHGSFPLAWSLDHIGPMTKTVKDNAYVLEAIAGFDSKDPSSINSDRKTYSSMLGNGIKGLRIGVNEEYFFKDVDENVEKAVRQALLDLEKAGATLVEVDIPSMVYSEFAELVTIMSEPSAIHHDNLISRPEDFGEDVRLPLKVGELFSAVDYLQAQQVRWQLNIEFQKVFQDVDVVITPTLPFLPPKIGQLTVNINNKKDVYYPTDIIRFTGPFNLTGLPAASIPCGYANGLPIGMQIVGPAFREDIILNTAYFYEQTHMPLKEELPIR